ncbi:MAG: ABC transporter permease [Polyangiaceae bacterium]
MKVDPRLIAFLAVVALLTLWLAWPLLPKRSPAGGRSVQRTRAQTVVAGAGTLFGLGFGVLAALALLIPQSAGGAFNLAREFVRYSALGVGVVFLLFVLSRALPLGLDLLERRGFVPFVGARHVRATKSGFLTVISVLSILGVSLSSCALCSVTSIMGGFGADLKRKILNNNAHIVIDAPKSTGMPDWEDTLHIVKDSIEKRGGHATPVVAGDAMGSSSANTAGVLVRGIDPTTIGSVIDLPENIKDENGGVGDWNFFLEPERLIDLPDNTVICKGSDGRPILKPPETHFVDPAVAPEVRDILKNPLPLRPAIILGRELAKSLHVCVGEEVTLLSPQGDLGPMGVMPRTRRFRVAAIFYSGMYEYDASHAYIDLKVAQEFFDLAKENKISEIDLRVTDAERVAEDSPSVDAAVKLAAARERPEGAAPMPALRTRDWKEMNKNLFSALKLERVATFVILSIAIAVASFCIICTLLLMVTEKGKQIAILKALGASDGAIMRIFMLEGIIIGAIGTVFGVMVALSTCTGLKWFGVRLNPEVYYIDRLPVNVDLKDYGLVALASMLICTLSTVYPALAASRSHPVEGLRHD